MVLVGPALVLYASFVVAPITLAIYYSLTDWNGVRPSIELVGAANYVEALGDPEVVRAFIVTGVIAIAATVTLNVAAIPLAVLLASDDRVTRVYRSFIFFPLVLAPIVVGFIWQSFLNTYGLLNGIITGLGFDQINFLGDQVLAVGSIIAVTFWQTIGFTTILYLAALKTIPDEFYEAARIDGANGFAQFRYLTVPLLAPAVTVNVVLLLIIFMRLYDYVVAMTAGGPAGATQTVAFLIIQEAFVNNRYGYGSAIAILLLVVVTLFSLLLFVRLRQREGAT